LEIVQTNGSKIVLRPTHLILGFQHQTEADRFLENLRERLGKFGLELHSDKTRRIEFGRFAEPNRERRGEGKPETFDFLGFTHICGKNGLGRFMVRRTTIRKRMRAKLREVKQQLRKLMHDPVPQTGQWLKSVVQGYFNCYAVPGNLKSLGVFRDRVIALWWRTIRRRSQSWCPRLRPIATCLVLPRIFHLKSVPAPPSRWNTPS
jgi:RNA-directed DNA polymerase